MEGYLEWLELKRKIEEDLKRYNERCASEDARVWHKYNTEYNPQQEDSCKGETPC